MTATSKQEGGSEMAEPSSKGTGPESLPSNERINLWVDRWQKGIDREESSRQIFRYYYRAVRSFFARRTISDEEIEDLVQEVFFRVYRNLGNFRNDSEFATWIFQISANVYKNAVRSQASQKRTREFSWEDVETGSAAGKDAPLQESVHPLDDLLQDERSRILQQAMQELPSQMRRCVQLRIEQDLKYREIAVLLDVSIDTVKAHLFQARQLLKAKLGDQIVEPRFADR